VTVPSFLRSRQFVAWLVLVAITAIYLWADHTAEEDGIAVASVSVTVSAILLGLLKFRIVMREFMDVRHAPEPLRRLTDILVVVIGVALFATYLIGRTVA
jgi:hypothetical protein